VTDPIAKIIAICALLVGCATFSVVYIVNIYRPRKKRRLLEHPGTAYFVVPTKEAHPCDYASQDADEHLLKELTLPSNSEMTVDFVIDLTTPINISEINIECRGETMKKPYAIRYFNRFIEVGDDREVSPGKGNRHYIDKHKVYHARGDKSYPPTRIAHAFVIKTGEPGVYPVMLGFVGDEVIGSISDLFITVEDKATVKMRCVDPEHREKPCALSGLPRP
jgi:hypothetical protein